MPSAFEKVGECLYRYIPTGMFYARYEKAGKEYRRSLRTKDKALAKRRLLDMQGAAARVTKYTLAEMCDRYLATIQAQKPKTITRKTRAAGAVKKDFPGGAGVPIGRVEASTVGAWLASYKFGAASYNHYLEFLRAVFDLAVHDGALMRSPIEHMKSKRFEKPIRETPSYEEFLAIVADIRANDVEPDAQDRADFVEFIGRAGLGTAETAALRWADVNWQTEQITTFRVKTSAGFVVPIFPGLRPMLERIKNERGGSPAATENVFRVMDARYALANACRRLGLPRYTHRALRRQFITRALQLGVDVKTVSSWQGHRDGGALILSTYSHVAPVHSARMAKLME